LKSPILLGGRPRNELNYANLPVPGFLLLVRSWALTAFRAILAGNPAVIDMNVPDVELLLRVLDGAKPSESTVVRIAETADRMGVLSDPFDRLSDIDRLVLDAGQLGDRTPGRGAWEGHGPVDVERFEELFADAAFKQPLFVNNIQVALDSRLKRSIILRAEQRLAPANLSPALHWIILALSLRPIGTGPEKRRAIRAHQLVQGLALRLARKPGWGGFWEQWVLRELDRAGGVRGDDVLCNMICTLPLVVAGGGALEPRPNTDEALGGDEDPFDSEPEFSGSMVVAERWVEKAPTFAQRLLVGAV
jgi:hypothetical protein